MNINWKQFLKPTWSKIIWFLLLWLFVIPAPTCVPDGPCYLLIIPIIFWISPLWGLVLTSFRISHLFAPQIICSPTLINCKVAGNNTVLLYWILQWISLVVSYIAACVIRFYRGKKQNTNKM